MVAQDVKRALDIWGPSLDNLKGKTISHKAQLQEEIATLWQLYDGCTVDKGQQASVWQWPKVDRNKRLNR